MRAINAVLIFFVCGLAVGLCFGFLLSLPSLTTFWFIKGSKFLIPTYRYYWGVGGFLFLGLAAAYAIARLTASFGRNTSLLRNVVGAVIVAVSPVMLSSIAKTLETRTATAVPQDGGTLLILNTDPITLYLCGIVAFVLLLSIACWILSARLYYYGLFLNFLMLPAGVGLMLVIFKVVGVANERSELFTYPVYFSLLSASCGFWIAKASRVDGS